MIYDRADLPGFLSDQDIKNYIKNGKIVICPYEEEENITPLGYNLTPTEFIFSINNRLLVHIYNDNNEQYCYVDPHDTVLILTREAVYVSNDIAGTFHSKVGIVTQGFGHISTTLDPCWQGPLLISLNNPTNKKLKFVIARIEELKETKELKESNKPTGTIINHDKFSFKYCSFVTLIFYRLVSESEKKHDNPSCRLDLLNDVVIEPKLSLWNKLLYGKKYKTHYSELKKFIRNIGEIDFIRLGIAEEEHKINVEEFKKKYEKFRETINFYTDAAHVVNKKIIDIKKSKVFYKKGILTFALIVPLGIILYIAWKYGIKSKNPATDGYFVIFALISLSTILSQVGVPIYKILTKNNSDTKGE